MMDTLLLAVGSCLRATFVVLPLIIQLIPDVSSSCFRKHAANKRLFRGSIVFFVCKLSCETASTSILS
jgi:hypothetical protein